MLRYRVLRDGSEASHLRAEERQVPKEPVSSDSVSGSRVPGFGEASEEHQMQRSPFPQAEMAPGFTRWTIFRWAEHYLDHFIGSYFSHSCWPWS